MNKLLQKINSALESIIDERKPLIKNLTSEKIAGITMFFGACVGNYDIVHGGLALYQARRNHADAYFWAGRKK